jgi:hypothetical protein
VNLEEAAKAVEMAWQLANGARPLEQHAHDVTKR